MAVSAPTIIKAFLVKYEEKFGRDYYVNSWHTTLAKRMGAYYTPTKIMSALNFYFDNYPNNDLGNFLDHLDDILIEKERTLNSEKEVEHLIKETNRRLKRIYEP